MPTGFEDHQIQTFFKQFGKVTRYCLKRGRYGNSLKYAYVEFDHPQIANIVENTLNCTHLYGTMLICKEVPPEKVNGSQFFRNHTITKAREFKRFDNKKVKWNNHATILNLEFKYNEWYQQLIKKEKENNDILNKHGIKYEFNGFEKEIKRQTKK